MLILLSSPDSILGKNKVPDPKIVALLKKVSTAHPVMMVSNHGEPAWFKPSFAGSAVTFQQEKGRQNGKAIAQTAELIGLRSFDVIVLAAKQADVQMGKNGGAILMAAGWSQNDDIKHLGIDVKDAAQLEEAIHLHSQWSGKWWFAANGDLYGLRALADLSTINKAMDQTKFAEKLKATVKNGGAQLTALLSVTARSLLMDDMGTAPSLVWGVYPSSASKNDDTEVLSDFTHRLRTTVSAVRFAAREQPLFIRHTASQKRSSGGVNRTDPVDQVTTLHLNPFYQTNNRLWRKNVVVIDDCTTYGLSFGVAAAFLRKAGAASVTGIAMGKFGNTLQHYDIEILTDPFTPVPKNGFKLNSSTPFPGSTSSVAQEALRSILS